MNTLDILIVCINAFLILVIYLIITKFWEYRIKQKLIKEGFIDEKSLGKIFYWNQKRELFQLLKLSMFSGCIAIGLYLSNITNLINYEGLKLIAVILGSLSFGGFISYFIQSKLKS